MIPSVFPASKEELPARFLFIKDMLEKMGLPILDEKIEKQMKKLPYFSE